MIISLNILERLKIGETFYLKRLKYLKNRENKWKDQ